MNADRPAVVHVGQRVNTAAGSGLPPLDRLPAARFGALGVEHRKQSWWGWQSGLCRAWPGSPCCATRSTGCGIRMARPVVVGERGNLDVRVR